jgi:hypothetical protein
MHELASITAGSFPSFREANTAQKLLESSVGPQRIEGRSQQNGRVESRFITLVQPDHRLVPIAQSNIDQGDVGFGRRVLLRLGLQVLGYFEGVLLLSLSPGPACDFKSAGAISANSVFTTSLATERRPGRVLRKLLGEITVRLVTNAISRPELVQGMVMETQTIRNRMTLEPDSAGAKPSHTAAAVRLGYGREHAQDKRRCCQDCHQSSHHRTCFQ